MPTDIIQLLPYPWLTFEEDIGRGNGRGDKELLDTTRRGNIEVSDVELANPELLHSKAGSVIAKEKYGVEDEDILNSICWHTTGRPGMSMLEKIIFIADYIEPSRANIPWIDSIRQKAFTDIDEAVALACKNSIDYLQRSSRTVDRITIDTYEYYKEHLK